jgi:hypothetical protein
MLEIVHPSIINPIRVANDVVDYEFEGNLYIGFPFELEIVSDTAGTPRGQLRIQNVDRRIGEAVLSLTSPPQLRIILCAQSDFADVTVGGRVRQELSGGTIPEYEASHLIFGNISVDAMAVSG